jgi:hypothetical protein
MRFRTLVVVVVGLDMCGTPEFLFCVDYIYRCVSFLPLLSILFSS